MNENDYQGTNYTQQNDNQEGSIPAAGVDTGSTYTGGAYTTRDSGYTDGNQMTGNQTPGAQRYENANRNYQYSGGNSQGSNDYQYGAGDNLKQRMYSDTYPNDYGMPPEDKKPKVKKKKEPGKNSLIIRKLAASMAMGIFFGLFAGISFYAVRAVSNYADPQAAAEVTADAVVKGLDNQTVPAITGKNSATTVVTDVTDVVDKVMPSVVSITNTFTERADYFGQTISQEQEAGGSGIIVGQSDTELLITTNFHVIEKAEKLTVKFIDGTEAQAQLKGNDSGMDLAVIAVQLADLTGSTKSSISIAELGDSESLKIGEPAIAIGNALGYGQSVTTGIISAVNRSISDVESTETATGVGAKSSTSLIQTDAAINPGNSGGALLNMNGEVIGINSNKIGGTVIEGMGYAIPISSAKPIIEDLMTKTTKMKVADENKAYLGISGVNVTADVAATYGLPEGVFIAQVTEGTAAEKAGLVKGNIITKFDGSTINSMEELSGMLQYYTAGTVVDITIQLGSPSGYQEKTISITLGAKPEQAVE